MSNWQAACHRGNWQLAVSSATATAGCSSRTSQQVLVNAIQVTARTPQATTPWH